MWTIKENQITYYYHFHRFSKYVKEFYFQTLWSHLYLCIYKVWRRIWVSQSEHKIATLSSMTLNLWSSWVLELWMHATKSSLCGTEDSNPGFMPVRKAAYACSHIGAPPYPSLLYKTLTVQFQPSATSEQGWECSSGRRVLARHAWGHWFQLGHNGMCS